MAQATILIPIVGAALFARALWKLFTFLRRPYLSPLRNLPGPASPSWLLGQFKVLLDAPNSVPQEEWVAKYGNNIFYTDILNSNRLFTMDARAINHVLARSNDYQRPELVRRSITEILGDGVLATEGEQHRQQRRVLNPAFGHAQIRNLTPIFLNKALKLRDIWTSELTENNQPKVFDVMNWLGRAALDIIGLAGFDYDCMTLESGQMSELGEAFKVIFSSDSRVWFIWLLSYMLPILNLIPIPYRKRLGEAKQAMHRIGMRMIAERKKVLLLGTGPQKHNMGQDDLKGKDLLTLLLRANIATDIPDNQRLSDEDVLVQITTFLFAGHETTSTSMAWCLYALAQAPHVQNKLRKELLSVSTETPTMDELMALPYLDMVIKEVLRIHAPVPMTLRQATKDDVIPVAEPYTDRYGEVRDIIRIQKGDVVVIPILAMNRSERYWGADAWEFKPERWEDPPTSTSGIPGVWSHILTFLAGPRACIGYRFSLIEMKAMLFTLIRAFEFKLAVEPQQIVKKQGVILRPIVSTESQKGDQLPLVVKFHQHP